MQVISRSRSPFPRTLPAAFTECFCSRRRFNSHFHSMRILSPVKAVRPRGCAGCSIWPLLGLGLAQEKRRRKRKGEEEEKEKEEGRGREGEEGGGRGRKEWEEAHYPGKKEHLHTSRAGEVEGYCGHIPCVHIKAQSCAHTCPTGCSCCPWGAPLSWGAPERGTTCSILQEHRCLNGLGIQGNIEGGALNTLPPLLGKFPERSHIEQEKKSLRAILSPEHSHHLPSPASSHRAGFPALLLAGGFHPAASGAVSSSSGVAFPPTPHPLLS